MPLILLIFLSLSEPICAETAIVSQSFIGGRIIGNAHSHASSMTENENGIFLTWFGGSAINNPDVKIWFAQFANGSWSKPNAIISASQSMDRAISVFNPVLFSTGKSNLFLFYKIGVSPSKWQGRWIKSEDSGKTWGEFKEFPLGQFGPTKNKPIRLSNGRIIAPSSSENDTWKIHIEASDDGGNTWSKIEIPAIGHSLIQPTILHYSDDALQLLCRSKSKIKGANNYIFESWSHDEGKTWSPPQPTKLKNPNSGIDAIAVDSTTGYLVYNDSFTNRSNLKIARSINKGKSWEDILTLVNEKEGEYSYPAIIQDRNGKIHISFSWKREKIRHLIVDPKKLRKQ